MTPGSATLDTNTSIIKKDVLSAHTYMSSPNIYYINTLLLYDNAFVHTTMYVQYDLDERTILLERIY